MQWKAPQRLQMYRRLLSKRWTQCYLGYIGADSATMVSPGDVNELPKGLTKHSALLMYERTEVAENLRELVNTSLYLSDLGLAFLDEGLLICEFMWREL